MSAQPGGIEPLYFSDYFGISSQVVEDYGAFDISVVSDLPLFIDPFLLFNSQKSEYKQLHQEVIKYLVFLRDKAGTELDEGLIGALYRFKEVKQNWLGFTVLGNGGHALGADFAAALHTSLGSILKSFGTEQVTRGSHLEKLCLIRGGVGRDNISDFTTNLIKHYLLEYTQTFAKAHLKPEECHDFPVLRARFNYDTESWETLHFYLPKVRDDFVLLTPADILTRDETWISHPDMLDKFLYLPGAVEDAELRAKINNYFRSRLSQKPTAKERRAAAQATITRFPQLIDLYIKRQEDTGDQATRQSESRVVDTDKVLVRQVREVLLDLKQHTDFFDKPWTSYDEALDRVLTFKDYVEKQDGYRVINGNQRPSKETEVQIFFGLIWCYTDFDVNREPNNGRGPVDFKVSYGAGDKSLIEFKLAGNRSLKRNLERQLPIYEGANKTRQSVKVIICYTAKDQQRVARILKDLGIEQEKSVVVVDARRDNKPSGSKA